jgi:hypothetical protein
MIRSFVEAMLGDFGRQILYFYEANACVFNSVIVTYGLFMLLAWNNMVRAYRFLIIEVAKEVHLDENLSRKSTNKRVRDTLQIPWERAVKQSPFPFLARLGALLPKRMSNETLQMYFDDKEIVDSALKLLKGENIRRMTPMSRQLIERERAAKLESKLSSSPEKNKKKTESE